MLRAAMKRLRPWELVAVISGVGVLAFVACTDEPEVRPPPAAPCTDPECATPPDSVTAGGGMPQGGSGGAGGAGGEEAVTLDGTVRIITSADLLDSDGLTVPVDVVARGFSQSLIRATTASDGSFRIEDLDESSALPVLVLPTEGDTSLDIVQTLQSVDSLTSTRVDLFALSGVMFDDLIDQSFIMNPTVFDPRRASAIVTVVDDLGEALQGVSLLPEDGQELLAYDSGAVYSDALEQTGDRGTFVLLNVPPARSLLRLLYNGEEFTSRMGLQAGAVTLHTARITPP
jgi:hypothetical protein